MKARLNKSCLLIATTMLLSCGDDEFLNTTLSDQDATNIEVESGDILILSGGTVARAVTPFPLHEINVFSSAGEFKGLLFRARSTEFLMGMSLNNTASGINFTIDTVDRVANLLFTDNTLVGNHILDGNLTGTTLRAVATLSDGGTVVAESTTTIEKFDADGNRVAVNFPITVTANIMKVRAISNNRFVTLFNGGNDSPVVRNNDGTLSLTVASGLPCGTNCDPSDIIELSDGRFVIAYQIATAQGLELYSSNFVRIGTLFRDTNILQGISTLSLLEGDDILACSTSFNVCERLTISGNVANRLGSSTFIGDAGKIRQPVDSLVVS
jgi:hypothetical protein